MPKKRVSQSKPRRPSLRERAEAAVRASRAAIDRMTREDILRLVDELQVHRIELEMQNEELRHAQSELAQSRDRFNDLYDFAPVGYLTLDQEGTVLEANLTAATMLGVARQKLVGRKFTRFVARAAQDSLYLHQRAALASETKQTCELLLRRADETKLFARMETIAITDATTGSRHCRSAILDITERKQVEEALAHVNATLEQQVAERTESLRESEARFRQVTETIDQVFWMTNVAKTEMLYVSPGYERIWGRTCRSLYDSPRHWLDAIHPEDRPRVLAAAHEKQAAGKYDIEYRIARPDGTERWIHDRAFPIRDAAGKVHRIAGVADDITKRKSAEDALRLSEERYRTLFNTLIEGFCIIEVIFDAHGSPVDYRFLETNPAFEKQTGLHNAQGKLMRDLAPNHEAHWFEIYGRIALTGEPARFVNEARALNRWYDVSAFRFGGEESRKVAILFNDITEAKRAADAVRESEERYRQLIHGLPAAIHTCDANGRIQLYNAAAVKLWGREPRPGRDPWCGSPRLFTPDGKRIPRTRCPIAMAVRQGEPIRGAELIVERPDGSRSHVLSFPDPIHDSSGAVVGAVNMQVDITALKEAENALLTSQRKLRTLSRAVEQSPASVLITSPTGEIEYVNPKFTEVTGYALEEVLGKNPRLLDSGEQPPALYQELWATITHGRDWRGDLCNRKKNGELFWSFVVIAPIQDEHGSVTHFVELLEDITERRSAEEALRRNEALLRSITDHTEDIIAVKDRDGRYLFANPAGCRIGGFPMEEVIGHTDVEFHANREEALRFMADDRRVMESRQAEIVEEEFTTRRGERCVLLANKMPRFDAQGRVIGVIIVCRDITERKRLEEEVLRISEDERQRVAADLHDGICQELVGAQYLSILLLRDLEKARHPLAVQARRIEEAIIKTTEHSRQVARGMSPVVADGSGLMHALRQLAETTARSSRIRCAFQCPVPISIENPTTANQLYRIAQEAIHNAVRHGQARRINLHLSETGDEVCLAVSDNGRGLPADVASAPGMGLRVMRYRAGLIGGQLTIQPRRRGGTEVICRLPHPSAEL